MLYIVLQATICLFATAQQSTIPASALMMAGFIILVALVDVCLREKRLRIEDERRGEWLSRLDTPKTYSSIDLRMVDADEPEEGEK